MESSRTRSLTITRRYPRSSPNLSESLPENLSPLYFLSICRSRTTVAPEFRTLPDHFPAFARITRGKCFSLLFFSICGRAFRYSVVATTISSPSVVGSAIVFPRLRITREKRFSLFFFFQFAVERPDVRCTRSRLSCSERTSNNARDVNVRRRSTGRIVTTTRGQHGTLIRVTCAVRRSSLPLT